MEEALVSVIIPVYNVEKYVGKCLETAINQSYNNLEIIIVNDGTKDNSIEVCEKYAAMDNRIRIVTKENGGLSSARNAGLDQANGRYCYFYDSDDYIELDTIKLMVSNMQEQNADLIAVNIDHILEDGTLEKVRGIKDNIYNITNEKERFDFYAKVYYNYGIGFEAWNKLYDMNIIREHGLRFENNYKVFAEDVCFVSYYLQHVSKVVSLSKVCYHYLVRENSIMGQSKNETKFEQFLYLLHLVYDYMNKRVSDGYMKEHFFALFAQLMHNRYKQFKFHQLWKLVRQAKHGSEEEFFSQARNYIIQNKEEIRVYFNELPPKGFYLGSCMVEETYVAEYADSVLMTYAYIIKMCLSKGIRKLKRIV